MRGDLELLRPRLFEDLRIVERHHVTQLRRALEADALGDRERVAVHPILFRIGVVVVVERPALEVLGDDDERVAFPMPHGITVVRRLDSFPVRPAVERDDALHTLELVQDDQVIARLRELHRVRGQHPRRETGRHAKRARLIVARIAGARLEERLAVGEERRKVLTVEDRGRAAARGRTRQRARPLVDAVEIGLAARRARDRGRRLRLGLLKLGARDDQRDRSQREDQLGSNRHRASSPFSVAARAPR